MMQAVLALDIGGTKLAAAVVSPDGVILAQGRAATTGAASAEELFAHLEGLGRSVLGQAGLAPDAVGASCAGPMDYRDGLVSPLNIPAWRRFPLRDRLAGAFGVACRLDNDVKALVLGEHWRGAGRGCRNLMGMVLSTGVGGGLIVDGRLLHGERGNAGHVGHVVVWPDGPRCACGARGCVEALASGTGLARRWREELPGSEPLSAIDLAELARAGDGRARYLFDEAGVAAGRGIAAATALLDLERVVLGGGIGLGAWDLVGPALERELRQCARLDFMRDVEVRPVGLGDAAGLVGAAALAYETLQVA